jgi:hypothetical protein
LLAAGAHLLQHQSICAELLLERLEVGGTALLSSNSARGSALSPAGPELGFLSA